MLLQQAGSSGEFDYRDENIVQLMYPCTCLPVQHKLSQTSHLHSALQSIL